VQVSDELGKRRDNGTRKDQEPERDGVEARGAEGFRAALSPALSGQAGPDRRREEDPRIKTIARQHQLGIAIVSKPVVVAASTKKTAKKTTKKGSR
jgi:hypothetical protein